jgi:alpha-galactosidase
MSFTPNYTDELLIDFRELSGEHSGENMAQALFDTLERYGLKARLLSVMADNASNNDTMCDALQTLCEKEGITFHAKWARLRCMPHTIHLSALAVCLADFAFALADFSGSSCWKALVLSRAAKPGRLMTHIKTVLLRHLTVSMMMMWLDKKTNQMTNLTTSMKFLRQLKR